MWLEHLLFGARLDAYDARGLARHTRMSCAFLKSFLHTTASRPCRKRRAEFIDKFEKDNEVKKNKKQIDQFLNLTSFFVETKGTAIS